MDLTAAPPQETESPPRGKRRPGRPRLETPSPEFLARRSELVEVAAEVFRKRGYEGVPLDEVADALGLRKASLYYYVRSKARLLYLVFDRAISLALDRVEQLSSAGSPRERLEAFIRHQVEMIAEDPNLFTVFFDQHYHLEDEYKAQIQTKERRYLRVCAEIISAAVADGLLPAGTDGQYAAQAILGMTSWIYKWFDPLEDDPGTFADVVVALILGELSEARPPCQPA